MRTPFFLTTVTLIISACGVAPSDNTAQEPVVVNKISSSASLDSLFTKADAEKIMGEPGHLTDNSIKRNPGVVIHYDAYAANVEGAKMAHVYFLIEQFDESSAAKNKYASTKKSNEGHDGINTLDSLGDEAYFHSDGENFHFIMVRKGAWLFSMKVSKITATTSVDEFNRVAKRITAEL